MKLSVLDQSTVNDIMPQSQAIRETLDLAKKCEQWGYHRYWVSEHHNSSSVAGTAPEILVAAIATATEKIKVGSAAVLISYYSPFKIAEQFSVIESLAPGRIELGIGRGLGADGLASRALDPHLQSAENYETKVSELLHWVEGRDLPQDNVHNHGLVTANPLGYTSPDVWIMGFGTDGAMIAAQRGLPYSYAHFFNDGENLEQALDVYRENFVPSEKYQKPHANICIWALAAASEQQAQFNSRSRYHWRIGFLKGERKPLQNPEGLSESIYTQEEIAQINAWKTKAIVGTKEQVGEKIKHLVDKFQLDDIVINTWTYHFIDKCNSYKLLSEIK